MFLESEVFQHGMSIIPGENFNICIIDFLKLCSNVPNEIEQKSRDFCNDLNRKFATQIYYHQIQQQHCKWTIEIFYTNIIDDVIQFNHNLKSMPESHVLLFVCLDNDVIPSQQASLQCSYIDSVFFQFDATVNINHERVFNYLQGKKSEVVVQNKLEDFYPLLLDINSISAGLVFNYHYSYLNRQISSTNNIFLTFTFTKDIHPESFPLKISVVLKTLVEKIFLEKTPSTVSSDELVPIQSNLLEFTFDSAAFRAFDGIQTVVTFQLIGVPDFGSTVEEIHIWQDKLDLSVLSAVQLKDDVRQWDEEYQPYPTINGENGQVIFIFKKRNDPNRECYFFPLSDVPLVNHGHVGISTMKKTTKDCYDLYMSDPKNAFTKHGRRISQILMVPVYYIILPSSCEFGPPDMSEPSECDEVILKGTIMDPNVHDRIQVVYAHSEVLQSRPMKQYNHYRRRTFYYVDELDSNNEIIRYLFCAEYPYILSILDQLEKSHQISKVQKHDECLRFCNMLIRLIQINNLSQSVKLIQFNDDGREFEEIEYADFKPLWHQIKDDIDQWYQTPDNEMSLPSIEAKILPFEQTQHVTLFFTDQAKEDSLTKTLINDLKEKLQLNDYTVEDAKGNLDLIETEKQIIFICTGDRYETINRQIMNAIKCKIKKYGVMRDVFILVNDAIRHFPCRFIRSIPYLTFDLHSRRAYLNIDEIQQIIHYLSNMNIFCKNSTDGFQDINDLLRKSTKQCASVGAACGGAFFYNYAKLLSPLSDHQFRMQSIDKQLNKENLINSPDNNAIFIAKWIFLIPWTIKDTTRLLSCALSLDEPEQQLIGFRLSVWKSNDPTFKNHNLSVTVGGVFQRSYSPLTIYKLTNLSEKKTFYFPMEIPAALHGLQNQYENILSHFKFGSFDPLEQAVVFRSKVEEYFSTDEDKTWHENILLVPLDNPHTSNGKYPIPNFHQAQILLRTLYHDISASIQHN